MIDPNETAETRRRNDLFQCYRRGWKHGACSNAYDKKFTEHARRDISEAYLRGYSNGRDAWLIEGFRECERLGYDPKCSILREQPPANPPPSAD